MKLPATIKQSTIKFTDPTVFRECFKIIMREWATTLTLRQLGVVMFIFDRTAAWGKEWELIRYESFVEGVTNKDGNVRYSAGVCNSVMTARTITKQLTDMEYLVKKRTPKGNFWALNYQKIQPTRPQKQQSECSKMNTRDCSKMNTPYNMKKRNASQNNKPSRASAQGEGLPSISVEDALARGLAKASAARERLAARKLNKMNSMDISKLWVATLQGAPWYERDPSGKMFMSTREAQAFKSYHDRFRKNYPLKHFKPYLTWLIHSWPELREQLFSWMTKAPPPLAPAPMFIIKFCEKFEDAWMQGLAFENKLVRQQQREDPLVTKERVAKLKEGLMKSMPSKRKPAVFIDRRRKLNTLSLPSMSDIHLSEYED